MVTLVAGGGSSYSLEVVVNVVADSAEVSVSWELAATSVPRIDEAGSAGAFSFSICLFSELTSMGLAGGSTISGAGSSFGCSGSEDTGEFGISMTSTLGFMSSCFGTSGEIGVLTFFLRPR